MDNGVYVKKYDEWNEKKKILEEKILPADFFFLEGEIWWAAVGVNIGHEIDGKNDMFERPVLILKIINDNLLWILPITSSDNFKYDSYRTTYNNRQHTVEIFQIRMISAKRLLRLYYRMKESEFSIIKEEIKTMISSIKEIPSA